MNNLELYENPYLDKTIFKNLKIGRISPKIHIIGNEGWDSFRDEGNCTGSGSSMDPYIIRDREIDGGGSGSCILIESSDVYFKIKNCTLWNSGLGSESAGISLKGVVNGIIENNTFTDTWYAVRLENSDYNLIRNNTIINGFNNGIFFHSYCQYNNVSNNIFDNGVCAIRSCWTNSNITISNNTMISNGDGIDFEGVNHTVIDNILKETSWGIQLDGGHNSKIFRNKIIDCENGGYGITITNSDKVKIINNTVKNIDNRAIVIGTSDYCEIINNTVSFNGLNENDHGIGIAVSNNVSILNNTMSFNTGSGLYISTSEDNQIINNKMHNNGLYGIYIYFSNNNNISKNFLTNNSGDLTGLSDFYLNGDNNSIFANYFINSGYFLARDLGNNNKWNSSIIGNYWSSYTGVDANDDGIGDSPHFIPQVSYDFCPIWWDLLQIVIDSPNMNDTFESSPIFNISVSRGTVNSSWYTLNYDIPIIPFTGLNGVIDKEKWNEKGVGSVLITFSVNDSKGYISSEAIQVFKYYDTPQISIISPNMSQICGITAPDFAISINDLSSINSTWYTIDGGLTNYTFYEFEGSINQTAWDDAENGPIPIKFYANDTWGFEGYTDVTIQKDTIPPSSMIHFTPYISLNIVNQTTVFYINADDGNGSGVLFIRYKINDSSWIDYTSPFVLSTLVYGDYNITYQAIDIVGNIELEKSIIITLVEISGDIPSEHNGSSIPGYHVLLLIASICVFITITIKKRFNLKP